MTRPLKTSSFFALDRCAFASLFACILALSINAHLLAQSPAKSPGSAKTPTPAPAKITQPAPPSVSPTPAKLTFPKLITVHFHEVSLSTEIARNEADREHGLMDRPDLPDNQGMLFVLPKPEQATFWMKDTLIPLSIAYINKDGVILEIHDMQPQDTSITPSNSTEVCYALECNQHWFELNGVHPGDKVDCSPYKISDFTPE